MVARTVLDTLRQVSDTTTDITAVFAIVSRLAQDVEPSVRAELMEQVPHIAMYCQELPDSMHHVVPSHLLPLVVKFLTDTNNQVRKTSQAALLVLLEQGLVDKADVEEQVCPVILRLTQTDSMDDYRTEAVALLSKMAPLIGKEMSERLFLDRFAALCVDPLFHVRKVCAANFGDFSGVVGSDPTEQTLLPKFFYLCEDGVWGVRKACADVFMPVSCVCSPSVRQSELSPLFINLLRDQSRWVRMAAFQALGPFISTFAHPAITALLHNENGEIVITDPDELAERLNSLERERSPNETKEASKTSQQISSGQQCSSQSSENNINNNNNCNNGNKQGSNDSTNNNVVLMDTKDDTWGTEMFVSNTLTSPEEQRASRYLDSQSYSSFLYWREPVEDLVDIDLEEQVEEELEAVRTALSNLDLESSTEDKVPKTEDVVVETEEVVEDSEEFEEEKKVVHEEVKDDDNENEPDEEQVQASEAAEGGEESNESTLELYRPEASTSAPSTFEPGSSRWETYSNSSLHSSRSSLDSSAIIVEPPMDPALPRGPPETEQSIVPQLLIDHYVSMIDPSRAQTVDNDIARHCAFSLPAVALTLGRTNWPLLKETYESLANDMQWKVRRTLASSIHRLGVILGKEVASTDLVPIFNGFIKDLDEVRIGILKHLADFLKLLGEDERNSYLPRLEEFLKTDNERNWRFRLELTEQLGILVPLVTPDQLKIHLAPIAITLIQDRVAAVRKAATAVLAVMVSSLVESEETGLLVDTLQELTEALALSTHWAKRQTFALLVGQLLPCIFWDLAVTHLLPPLLDLATDRVPNVRLQVAHILGHVIPDEHITNASHPRLDDTLSAMAADKDPDVREAACNGGRVQPNPPPRDPHIPDPVAVPSSEDPDTSKASSTLEMESNLEEPLPTWAQIAEVIQEKI